MSSRLPRTVAVMAALPVTGAGTPGADLAAAQAAAAAIADRFAARVQPGEDPVDVLNTSERLEWLIFPTRHARSW